MAGTVITIDRFANPVSNAHLSTVRPVYHHYSSSGHSGSVSVPVLLGVVALVTIVLVVRKLMSSN